MAEEAARQTLKGACVRNELVKAIAARELEWLIEGDHDLVGLRQGAELAAWNERIDAPEAYEGVDFEESVQCNLGVLVARNAIAQAQADYDWICEHFSERICESPVMDLDRADLRDARPAWEGQMTGPWRLDIAVASGRVNEDAYQYAAKGDLLLTCEGRCEGVIPRAWLSLRGREGLRDWFNAHGGHVPADLEHVGGKTVYGALLAVVGDTTGLLDGLEEAAQGEPMAQVDPDEAAWSDGERAIRQLQRQIADWCLADGRARRVAPRHGGRGQ